MSGSFNCRTHRTEKQPDLRQAQELADTRGLKRQIFTAGLCQKQLELPSCPP